MTIEVIDTMETYLLEKSVETRMSAEMMLAIYGKLSRGLPRDDEVFLREAMNNCHETLSELLRLSRQLYGRRLRELGGEQKEA